MNSVDYYTIDPWQFFRTPDTYELCDWYTVGKNEQVLEEQKGAPCFYQMCGNATDGCTRVYVGLRMPSMSMGMDLEDDINREARMNGATEYAWKFEHGKKGKHYKKEDDTYALAYWRYIFDPVNSPWRKALQVGVKLYEENGEIIGVHIDTDRTTDAQIILSLLMAARIPWECLGHLRVYGQLLDAGFIPSESIYIMTHIRQLKDGGYDFRSAHGHFPFSPEDTDIAYSWMRDGTPNTSDIMFIGGANYGCVDCIWDRQKRRSEKAYMPRHGRSLTENTLYKLLANDIDYAGAFAKAYKKSMPHGKHIGRGLGEWREIVSRLNETRKEWAY